MIFAMRLIILIENIENFSAFCKAILLGTSSPKTKVKYPSIRVMDTKAISFAKGIPSLLRILAKSLDIPTAADADVKKPARVIPTWIVDRNLDGSLSKSSNILAFLSPSSALAEILFLSTEIIAISEAAKSIN